MDDETREPADAEPLALSAALVGAGDPAMVAVARALARRGADLLLVDAREEALARAQGEVESDADQSQVVGLVVDPRQPDQVATLAERVADTLETLDLVVVATARGPKVSSLLRAEPAAWLDTLDSGLFRLVSAMSGLMPALRRGELGQIVAITGVEQLSATGPAQLVADAAVERYLAHLAAEAAGIGLVLDRLYAAGDRPEQLEALASRVLDLAVAATRRPRRPAPTAGSPSLPRSALAASSARTPRAVAVASSTAPEAASPPEDPARERLRDQLGALYSRRAAAVQKKRELGDGWTPRFEAAYQDIERQIAQLEQQMGLPPSRPAASLPRKPARPAEDA